MKFQDSIDKDEKGYYTEITLKKGGNAMPNAVQKTLQLLRILSDARGRPVTPASISEQMEIPKTPSATF